MKRVTLLLCLLAPVTIFSQVPSGASEGKSQTLQERYLGMKSSSQTFKEYKVIKEVALDNEWGIFQDSVKSIRGKWHEAKSTIGQLEGELSGAQLALKQKEESTAKIEHAASHIDFFGMDFNKAVFTVTVILVVAGLAALLGLMVGRLKILGKLMREKNEFVDRLTAEFEEYKHKALEKQTKLSRELQNERNKLQDLRRV